MSDIECWIYFEGPVPASVRPLLDAFRGEGPMPTEQDQEEAIAEFYANVDAMLAFARSPVEPQVTTGLQAAPKPGAPRSPDASSAGAERSARPQGARFSALLLPPVQPSEAAGGEPAPVTAEPRAATDPGPAEPDIGFRAWAELSVGLIGKTREEKLGALSARGVRAEDWARIDEHHLGVLSSDLVTRRMERQAVYEAACDAEMARRAASAPATSAVPRAIPPATPVAAAAPPAPAPVAPPPAPAPLPTSMPVPAPVPAIGLSTAISNNVLAAAREAPGKQPVVSVVTAAEQKKRAPKTMPVRVMPDPSGGTLGLDDGGGRQQVAASVPLAGSATGAAGAAGASPVGLPELTVQQYVSLRFDLELRPEQHAETLARYGVPNDAALRALQQRWQERLAASPALRAEVATAVATYTSWLKGLPR